MVQASTSKCSKKKGIDDEEGLSSCFEKGELFSQLEICAETNKESFSETIKNVLSNKKENLCPRCKKPGSGPYSRWVRNSAGKVYSPYYYFAHRVNGKVTWCYITRTERARLDNPVEKQSSSQILGGSRE